MKKHLLLLAALPIIAFGADTDNDFDGGIVANPKSQRGYIEIINAQSKMSEQDILTAIRILQASTEYAFKVVNVKGDGIQALIAQKKSPVAIVIVDDDKTPALLAAPTEHWSAMNVRRMTDGLRGELAIKKFTASRCRKQFMRAFAFASGGCGTGFQSNILASQKISDLDLVKEFIPEDAFEKCRTNLAGLDITPLRREPYHIACYEGWAPAPTNAVQKKIWKLVHEPPQQPMKIKYDGKAKKPTVTK